MAVLTIIGQDRSALWTVILSLGIFVAIVRFLQSLSSIWTRHRPLRDIPIVALDEEGLSPKESWRLHATRTLEKGLALYDGPFQVATGVGPTVLLPNRYADELKNHPDLKFGEASMRGFFASYPGFQHFKPFLAGRNRGFLPDMIRTKVTQSLGLITHDLVDETTKAVHDIFGEDKEWHKAPVKTQVVDLVGRLSSRVFLGEDICRDQRWLNIARDFTMHTFAASRGLWSVNPFLRPIKHWFMESCIALRKDIKTAGDVILPEIEKRRLQAEEALAAGQKVPKKADVIGWMVEAASEKRQEVNYVHAQLNLSLVAIHTTSEAITNALIDIMTYPDLVKPLREEVISIIREHGWQRTSLYKMQLMDSFLKESQRLSPPNRISMRRLVKQPLRLSSGELLPAGTVLAITNVYLDPKVHKDPLTFNAWRFVGGLDPESVAAEVNWSADNKQWHHVSLNPSHMGFGYGNQACPGRFFASNEIKIAMAHLLLKYDWRSLQPDAVVAAKGMRKELESTLVTLPTVEMEIRRRKEEIVLDL